MATVGYAGYAPVAPGTAGSAVAMAVYLAAHGAGCRWSLGAWSAAAAAVLAAGIWAAGAMEREWGRDPGAVVIDEVLGYMVTVAGLPVSVSTALVGFLLFRALDIVKPPPARHSERLPGGWGIMADDLIAGVYANLLIRAGGWAVAHWNAG